MTILLEYIQVISAILFAVILHEYSHGWIAEKLGDPTARMSGRLTFNPLKHIDPVGTVLVPLVLKLLGFVPLGWAKPVPVNFSNLRHPKQDMIWVALAGPGSNLLAAFVLSRVLFLVPTLWMYEILAFLIMVNLLLAVFNLLPIPPLDGSRVLMGLLPLPWARKLASIERFGFLILIVLLNLGILQGIWTVVLDLAMLLGVDLSILT